jgi:hypothetical protein
MSDALTKQTDLAIAQGERDEEAREIAFLRTLSDRERGAMIAAACRAAAKIEEGRIKSGLPPIPPDSWPASTWELLRKLSANARG